MYFYILFIEIVYGSQLYSRSKGSVENQNFRGCIYSGSNSDYVLFQCIQHNAFVPKLELTQKQIGIYSQEKNGETYLSNYLICDLITKEGQKTLSIGRISNPEHSNLIQQEHNIMFYELTQIDSIHTTISILRRVDKQNYIIELLPMLPGNVNQFYSISYKFNSHDNARIIGFSQYYNKIRNSLLLIVLKQNQLKLIEYSLFDKQFRDVSTYSLSENNVPQKWRMYKSGYIIITYEQFQVLYNIGEVLYEIQEIYRFDSQPLQMLTNFDGIYSNYILQQNMNGIKLFIIEENNYQFYSKSVRLIQQYDLPYSHVAFLIDQTQLMLIYDQFETMSAKIDHLTMDQFQECEFNIEELPKMNLQSIQYQQRYEAQPQQQQLNQVQSQQKQKCQMPCDIIYGSLNISLVPHKSECIFESLYNQFVHGCNRFNSCYACMKQTGCEWIDEQCQGQQNQQSVGLNQNRESSKWFVNKIMNCGSEIEFNSTYYGNVPKGSVFTWFYDANAYQQFNLLFSLQVDKLTKKKFIQQSICLGNDTQQLCDQIMISDYKSDFIFKGYYFRMTIVMLEDILVNDLTVTFKQQDPQADTEDFKIKKLTCLLLGALVLFGIIIYIANKRMNYLISLTLQDSKQSLDNDSLSNVMDNMIKEKVLMKQCFSSQVLRYDEDKCPFCIEKYETKQEIVQIFCGHTFHLECFEDWIRINTKLVRCPICNQTIEYFLKNKEQFKKSIDV
ncbi:unnamed protein product (macronuclear) [Paramecium tetraurelia]|uniref:RING-type domain-containing protein n=1 Tax=Paramecium tetraurelia TaxID=5888 RepID=A0BEP3_PARTE|nr:uncharacterized protein GSPATT00028043001 [Paramecium tetraurelia]CAK57010.1 unnamed protein product [Paramecium tetraurelia]|eukprot:XP_001424408.1 hypothetical protein (macronuclear) [Paramecium tetraurelia strain d4-2]